MFLEDDYDGAVKTWVDFIDWHQDEKMQWNVNERNADFIFLVVSVLNGIVNNTLMLEYLLVKAEKF